MNEVSQEEPIDYVGATTTTLTDLVSTIRESASLQTKAINETRQLLEAEKINAIRKQLG